MRRFHEAVAEYMERGADPEPLRIKLDHSLRVLAEAEDIVAEEGEWLRRANLPARVPLLAALYHDLGRFPQYVEWGTFSDPDSANHATLSVRALQRGGLLAELPPGERRAVLASVAMHNRRFPPKGLPLGIDACLRMVRDADKLDICRVMLERLESTGEAANVVNLGLADEPETYTREMLERVAAGELADYTRMRYRNDFRLLLLSWVHDLNTGRARRAYVEKGHLERLLAGLPPGKEVERLGESLRAALREEG
ncbi:HD domain-containing protein [Desulfohalovibrio reitneri]|uniref:HD domain-containing protein n=1 Tax=Desulfohalovibrio reitneri TaxID=1307759 RepID=UPI0004A724DF|nr:HD domain-containing protein [Desulfohalovibrio reitneri]